MGTFEINWLARQQTDGICIGSSYFVMRKVRMKVEGGNTLEQAEFVQVSIGCHRHQIVGSFNGCGAEPVYCPNRCCRGTSGSRWCRYSICRCFISVEKPTS